MANEFPPTHFFKIICDQSLHQGKLIIPRKFVEKYGEGLSNAIYLKTPNGAKWKLNLVKSDGKIWFEKGWKEFVKYHSLSQGHLLLFKYGRTSHFHVHIFDKSALEIKYPSQRVESKRVSNDLGNKPQNDEDLEDYIASKKRKTNLSFEFNQPYEIGSNSCVNVGKLEKVAALNHIDKKCKGTRICVVNVS
ncbi:B3 domain-containing protein At4g01580 [Medicago truncatula]|uniref:B3 domain-containing protein At4g01580 n=1 Tax=Medicago truncatula TaxID=3880 RepID=UPI001967ED9F|nr:B3 domain-containing protein At4g01580-like [Medicago truncatula]